MSNEKHHLRAADCQARLFPTRSLVTQSPDHWGIDRSLSAAEVVVVAAAAAVEEVAEPLF